MNIGQNIGQELYDATKVDDPEKEKYDMKKSGQDQGLILPYNGQDEKNTVLLPNTLGNLKDIFQAILDGDESALNTPEFTSLNFGNIKAALEWLAKTDSLSDYFKETLLTEGWRLNFKCKPPTPEEFLTEKYLGPTAETLYEPVRKAFIEFMDPLKPYRNAILSLHIGWGKAQPYSSLVATDYSEIIDTNGKSKYELKYSTIGSLKINDTIIVPGKNELLKAKVFSIQEQGISDIYRINLSNGKSFKTHKKHLTTVCFRQKNNKPVWDSLTTEWMMKNPQYHYTILENYSRDIKFQNFLQLVLEHDNEPDDDINPYILDGTYILSIEKLSYQENCRCITLNDPVGLYYTNNGILTHNSSLSAIIQLYISTHFAMMWHPYKYFGQSSATVYIQALGAWSQKKGSEILLEPITNIIESSPYFKQVRGHADMIDRDVPPEEVANQLLWTTATKTAQPLDCKVYLPDGSYKLMKDVKVGDIIASPTKGEVEVTAIPYEGEDECYEIELEDGRKTRCNAEHLWKVSWEKDKNKKPIWKIVQTQFMIDYPELEFEIFDIGDE